VSKYQFVVWPHLTLWGFSCRRTTGTLAFVYTWVLRVGPLEIRRCVTDTERRRMMGGRP
jgi:hypothetical protein